MERLRAQLPSVHVAHTRNRLHPTASSQTWVHSRTRRPLPAPEQKQFACHPTLQTLCGCVVSCILFVSGTSTASAAASVGAFASEDNMENVPSTLSAKDDDDTKPLSTWFSGASKGAIEECTRKCLTTCVRGGEGAPGLGPISLRKEVVEFKDGFRSRQYCINQCARACSLSINSAQKQP